MQAQGIVEAVAVVEKECCLVVVEVDDKELRWAVVDAKAEIVKEGEQ